MEIVNNTQAPVRIEGSACSRPWQWDERSLYFRAKWRADHDLLAAPAPSICRTWSRSEKASSWLRGDDHESVRRTDGWRQLVGRRRREGVGRRRVNASTFGTGSEDYFNYSWSRPDLFAHPYCGQPLDSGPDTSGYVSNHRFQVLDAITFEKSLAVFLELWVHNRTPGLSYARIAYHYARPGAIDDHRL